MHYERFVEKEGEGLAPAIKRLARATRHWVWAPQSEAAKEQKQNQDYKSDRELGSSRFGGSATNASLCRDPSNYDNDMLSHSLRGKEQQVAAATTRGRHTVDAKFHAENDVKYPCDSRAENEFLATRQLHPCHVDCDVREDEDLRSASADSLHSRISRDERFTKRQMKTVERQGREFSPLEVGASGTGNRAAVAPETRTDGHTPVTQRDSDVSSGPADGILVDNRGQEGDDDLADLPYIDEDVLLQQVEKRFRSSQPYTYIGDTLVAVNPCRQLSIYTQEYHDNYSDLRVRCSLPAHIFWVADQMYRNMLSTPCDQCVVVGGESGAGKTESTKLILKHLVYAERHHQGSSLGAAGIISRLETVSPLLEIFGNAATTLNENSSRFGKLVELEYDDGQIKSARIEGFLLEKYRVTNRNAQEKNFHVFYALLAGLPPQQLSALKLADAGRFRIISSDDPAEPVFRHSHDKQKYRQLYQSMDTMLADIGFTATEVESLLKVLSAILLISNVEFRTDAANETVEIVKGSSRCCLNDAAHVLGLPQEELETCLLQATTEVNGETIARNKDERQARTGRDALARELYSVLFYGAIDKINARLREGQAVTSPTRNRSICLLDISGFENGVDHNGFEQFVINSTNEKLHQYFLQHTFEEERREYEREGISSVNIDYVDNADVVDLIFKKPDGLIPLLEDQNRLSGSSGSSANWLHNCRRNNSAIFNTDLRPRGGSRLLFEIKHYAGQVVYSAEDFVQKNSETLPGNLREAVQRSDNPFIRDYFSLGSDAIPARNGILPAHKDSKYRVGKLSGCFTDQFKTSLSRMMSRLSSATPIFIRCIKPNQSLTASKFDPDLVRVQLLHSGLVEVAMVRKYGYPIRIKFSDFVERYGVTCDMIKAGGADSIPESEACQNILQATGVDGYQLGRTKVFLKLQHRDKLEDILKKKEMEPKDGEDSSAEKTVPPDDLSSYSSSGISSATSKETLQEAHPSPVQDGGSGHPAETNNEGEEAPETIGKQPAYDIFRLTERDYENSMEFEMKVRRIVRFILYILLALILLATGLTARLVLIWLASPLLNAQDRIEIKIVMGGNPKETEMSKFLDGLGPTRLLACQLLPLLLGWIACCFRVIFGRKDWPTFKALIVVFIIDCMGTVGRSVFLFKILPAVNIPTAVCLGTAVCQVPAILKLASLFLRRGGVCALSFLGLGRKSRRLARVQHVLYVIALVLAVVVQLGTIPLLFYGDAIVTWFKPSAHPLPLPELWTVLVVILGVSVGWWENFAFGEFKSCAAHVSDLSRWRTSMSRMRMTSHVYTAPAQIVIAVSLYYGLNRHRDGVDLSGQLRVYFVSLGNAFANSAKLRAHWAVFGLMYMQILSVLVCGYVAGLACRLYMQRFAFALPVSLVAPATLAVAAGCTPSSLSKWFESGTVCVTSDVTEPHILFVLTLGGVVWLSMVVITAHIWSPEVERTAKHERLFAFPHRDPVFPDICLACSRRQDQAENADRKQRHKKSDRKKSENVGERPLVYICATMWHEIRQEMLQLMKSLFRVDFDIYTRTKAMEKFFVKEENSDLYDAEIHIIFDDAFETEPKSKQRIINQWVRQFVAVMPEAIRSVAKQAIDIQPPKLRSTPFGGRMSWVLPGGTHMHVHLKDKEKIRARKRWSQILYLYYLLGFKFMSDYDTVDDILEHDKSTKRRRRPKFRKTTSILNNLPPEKVRQAENTFIMTLDGDVDFWPDSVRLLLDRMKKNKKVAAVCGRIHPIGDGPMIWYQQFEYAVGHWLQKATEHVFGCVLCCPGCFSLFRGSALMDDNVLRMYTTEPTEAIHYIQYEQGEDRWLCTLLLQQGYKIEYCAGADALTFAPETFHDFYIQRRRWSPSTLANIMDLIGSWRITVKMNDNISVLFMMYQFVLLASSIIAPGTVVYMIAGSYSAVLGLDLWKSYLLSVVPVFLYVLLCLKAKTETQINVAAILSSVYAIVMLLVTVGTIINLATSSIYSPTVLFLVSVAVIFVVAGFLHPNEIFCLANGILYYITVPSTFVFLTVFFLCNFHVVSWGTREDANKVAIPAEVLAEQQQEKGKLYRLFEKLGLHAILQDVKAFVSNIIGIKQELTQTGGPHQQASNSPQASNRAPETKPSTAQGQTAPRATSTQQPPVQIDEKHWANDLKSSLSGSEVDSIDVKEEEFWKFLVKKYLVPRKADAKKEDKIAKDLVKARNNVVFAYMLINFMFTLVLLQLKMQMDVLKDTFYIAGKYEPVSTMALAIFSLLLLTQFLGMMSHRWSTFMHLIASTKLNFFHEDEEDLALAKIEEVKKLTSAAAPGDLDLEPDYMDDDENDLYLETATGTVRTTTTTTPADLQTLEDVESTPDYSDNEDEHHEADFKPQYDKVFHERYRTVRKHWQLQRRRSLLYAKNNPSPFFANRQRHQANLERRQSLYTLHSARTGGLENV